MQTNVTKYYLLIFIVLSMVIPFTSFGQYAVGDTVADFTLNDLSGNSVSLSDFDGQVILLNFFATW